ncbi:hypothetical protein SUGI_0440900 [Cryptomeria japonica]|nr:hypothetical protein SUGI_0440900 [Cryptomeria japonica]
MPKEMSAGVATASELQEGIRGGRRWFDARNKAHGTWKEDSQCNAMQGLMEKDQENAKMKTTSRRSFTTLEKDQAIQGTG